MRSSEEVDLKSHLPVLAVNEIVDISTSLTRDVAYDTYPAFFTTLIQCLSDGFLSLNLMQELS